MNTFHIHHQKVGVLQRIILPHTPDEAMSVGLAKACVPGKNCSVPEKIEFLIGEHHISAQNEIFTKPVIEIVF